MRYKMTHPTLYKKSMSGREPSATEEELLPTLDAEEARGSRYTCDQVSRGYHHANSQYQI